MGIVLGMVLFLLIAEIGAALALLSAARRLSLRGGKPVGLVLFALSALCAAFAFHTLRLAGDILSFF